MAEEFFGHISRDSIRFLMGLFFKEFGGDIDQRSHGAVRVSCGLWRVGLWGGVIVGLLACLTLQWIKCCWRKGCTVFCNVSWFVSGKGAVKVYGDWYRWVFV